MLILDTDHLTEIDRGMAAGARLVQRLDRAGEEVATTIVSAEEQLRGWLAQIGRLQDPYREIGLQAFARAACVLRSVECAALDARSGGDFFALARERRSHWKHGPEDRVYYAFPWRYVAYT